MSKAFIVRMKTWDEETQQIISRIPDGLRDNDLILGWSSAEGLIDETTWDGFKNRIAAAFRELMGRRITVCLMSATSVLCRIWW